MFPVCCSASPTLCEEQSTVLSMSLPQLLRHNQPSCCRHSLMNSSLVCIAWPGTCSPKCRKFNQDSSPWHQTWQAYCRASQFCAEKLCAENIVLALRSACPGSEHMAVHSPHPCLHRQCACARPGMTTNDLATTASMCLCKPLKVHKPAACIGK